LRDTHLCQPIQRTQSGGDRDSTRTVYLHFFASAQRKMNEDAALKEMLMGAKEEIGKGICMDALKNRFGISFRIVAESPAIKPEMQRAPSRMKGLRRPVCHGIFMIIINRNIRTFDALIWYRRRTKPRDFFLRVLQDAGQCAGWSAEALQERMFVQFVTLCISQYAENEILCVRDACASGEMTEGKKTNKTMRLNTKLFDWMASRFVVRILNWFDVCEQTAISEELKRKRWSSSETARDRLFLEKPGIFPPEHAPQWKKTGCR